MNLCRGCYQDFGGVELFDRHRVGKHEYTYAEGLHYRENRVGNRPSAGNSA